MNNLELSHALSDLRKTNEAAIHALGEALYCDKKVAEVQAEKTAVAADDTSNHQRLDTDVAAVQKEQVALFGSKIFTAPLTTVTGAPLFPASSNVVTLRDLYAAVQGAGQQFIDGVIAQDYGFGKFAEAKGPGVPAPTVEERLAALESHPALAAAAAATPAPEAPAHTGKLPDGFPGLAALNAAGINTYGQLAKAGDVTEISGIGPVTAQQINEALAEPNK